MSENVGGSKKALSSFFAKNKNKKTDSSGGAYGNGAASGNSGVGGDSATAATGSTTSSSKNGGILDLPSEYSSWLGDGPSSSGWIAETPEETLAPVESIAHNLSKLKMHVVDASHENEDDEDDEDIRRRIVAEEGHKVLAGIIKKNKSTTAAAAASAPVTTTSTIIIGGGESWKDKIARKRLAEANGEWADATGVPRKDGAAPNMGSIQEFPTLPGQKPGENLQGVAKKEKSISEMGSKNLWDALGSQDDDEEEEEEEARRAEAAAKAAATAAIAAAAAKETSATTSAAPPSTTTKGGANANLENGLQKGVGPELTTGSAVRDLADAILREFKSSNDGPEALLRFGEIAARPISLRSHVVDAILSESMETEKMNARMQLAKLLNSLIPAKIVSREMLLAGVVRFSAVFDDLRLDAGSNVVRNVCDVISTGIAEGTLKSMNAGLVTGTPTALIHSNAAVDAAGYVPLGYIHKDLAIDLQKQVGGGSSGGKYFGKQAMEGAGRFIAQVCGPDADLNNLVIPVGGVVEVVKGGSSATAATTTTASSSTAGAGSTEPAVKKYVPPSARAAAAAEAVEDDSGFEVAVGNKKKKKGKAFAAAEEEE